MFVHYERLPNHEFSAIDLDTYDGAPDSLSQEIGYGKTMREALEDLRAQLKEKE